MKHLKELRLKKGLTQQQLADKINRTYHTIGKWEKGLREPNQEDLIMLSNIFKVSTDYLLDKENAPTNAEANPLRAELEGIVDKMTEKQQAALLDYLRSLLPFAVGSHSND